MGIVPLSLAFMLGAAACAALASTLLTPGVKRLAHLAGVVRYPRDRDIHVEGVPLWGGLAMYIAVVLTVVLHRSWMGHGIAPSAGTHPLLGILLGGTLIAVVGLLDDKYDLPAWAQALSLLGGGFVAALCGVRIEGVSNPFLWPPTHGQYRPEHFLSLGHLSIPVTMLWVFLVAKTLDFLDGLDGLAAGVCAISAATMGLLAVHSRDMSVALLAGAVVGACLGFLRHNYRPASIFMGTIGAQFLGFLLACLAIVGAFKIPAALSVIIPPLVLGVPVFDGLFVVLRRLYLRQPPHHPDRSSHIHHRLLSRGMSTEQAVWTVYGLTAAGCLLALALAWVSLSA